MNEDQARVVRVESRLAERRLYSVLQRIVQKEKASTADVLGRRRHASVVRARHLLWSALFHEVGMSSAEMGRMLEVDHTTILTAVSSNVAERREAGAQAVVTRIARYVRSIGYDVLASEIEGGTWRKPVLLPAKKCAVPACPKPGLSRASGQCGAHPQAELRAS